MAMNYWQWNYGRSSHNDLRFRQSRLASVALASLAPITFDLHFPCGRANQTCLGGILARGWAIYFMNTPTIDEYMEGGCIRTRTKRSVRVLSIDE